MIVEAAELIFALQLLLCKLAASQYYVVAKDGAPCPDSTTNDCHNLSYYADNSQTYFSSDTTFVFLRGTHLLEGEELLVIEGVRNLTLEGEGEMEPGFHSTVQQSNVMITCANSKGGLAMINCSDITLRTITLFDCGGFAGDLINNNTFWYRFNANGQVEQSLLLAYVTGLSLFQVSVQNCTGRGLSVLNALNASISQSYFSQNNLASYYVQGCQTKASSESCIGGNAQFLYEDNTGCATPDESFSILNITNSSFSFGVDLFPHLYVLGSGLGISLFYSSSMGIEVHLSSLTLYGNTGYYGANLYITVTNTVNQFSVTLTNVTSKNGNNVYPLPDRRQQVGQYTPGLYSNITHGAGLFYWSSLWLFSSCHGVLLPPRTDQLTISESTFSLNRAVVGAGMYLDVYPGIPGVEREVVIENTTTSNNTGKLGVGMSVQQHASFSLEAPLHVLFDRVTVSDNGLMPSYIFPSDEGDLFYQQEEEEPEEYGYFDLNGGVDGTAMDVTDVKNATLSGLVVSDHAFAGIHTYNSITTIKGETSVIRNNRGKNGGGWLLSGNSYIVLKVGANLTFVDNSAIVGAGIFVEQIIPVGERHNCFFQVDDPESWLDNVTPDVVVYFSGNRASLSADVLYSTSSNLLDCNFVLVSYYTVLPRLVFTSVFNYSSSPYQAISSSAVRVCFCDESNLPDCSVSTKNRSVVPGEPFTISAVTLGLFYGVTPGIVEVLYHENSMTYKEELVKTRSNCTELPLTVNSASEQTYVFMLANDANTIKNVPVVVNVTLLPCPPGFALDESLGKCDCSPELKALGNVTCDITTGNITRSGKVWIAYEEDKNCTVGVSDCPFDYCISGSVTFDIASPNPQCSDGRSGTLCGKCEANLSLELGSNNCRACSNAYIALIVPFFLAGLALVVFIIALNLTVSVGTINGLIFYANVVKINEFDFFPDGPVIILSQFISWLNLDLGINTCFYDGMDAYAKTWLQFLFPFYVWMLVAVLVVLARWFERVAKFLGDSAVPVLCTLFLLSYTKVLRTVIQVMQLTHLTCADQNWKVWSVDGTVDYFDLKHFGLFLFALFVLLFIAIPYTGLTLFIPLLESYLVRYKTFAWLVRLKPYFDANGGPYKDKYRFWPGLLLLARLILAFTVPYTDSTADQWTILVLTIGLMALVMVLNGVYRKWYLNVLDTWSLVNIALFNNGMQPEISVGLALATFVGIVCYHVYLQIRRRRNWGDYSLLSEERRESIVNSKVIRRLTSLPLSETSRSDGELLESGVVTMRRDSMLMNFSTDDDELHLNLHLALSDKTNKQPGYDTTSSVRT